MNYVAAERNAVPIIETMLRHVPPSLQGGALELASGTGQHVKLLASSYPGLIWLPSDVDPQLLASISQHTAGLTNVLPPLQLDVTDCCHWPSAVTQQLKLSAIDCVKLVVCVNLFHVAPWRCAVGLFSGCGQLLAPGGVLMTYGPYAKHGRLEPESNVIFDAGLRRHNPEWGVRDISELEKLAKEHNIELEREVDMPANNKCLFWRKAFNS